MEISNAWQTERPLSVPVRKRSGLLRRLMIADRASRLRRALVALSWNATGLFSGMFVGTEMPGWFGVMRAGANGYRLRYAIRYPARLFERPPRNGLIRPPVLGTGGYCGTGDIVGGVGFIDEGNFSSSIRTIDDMEVQSHLEFPIRHFGLPIAINHLICVRNGKPPSIRRVFSPYRIRGDRSTRAVGFIIAAFDRLSYFDTGFVVFVR